MFNFFFSFKAGDGNIIGDRCAKTALIKETADGTPQNRDPAAKINKALRGV